MTNVPVEATDQGLSRRVAKSTLVIIGSRLFVRVGGFINTLILVRLLAPADFGVVALGISLLQLLQNVTDVGVSQAVIRFGNAGRSEYDTLFTLSAIRGLLVCALLCVVALFSQHFYDDPRLKGVFVAAGLVALVQSLQNPKFHEFERDMNFGPDFAVTLSVKLAAVLTSVCIAYFFRTHWALMLGFFVGALTQTLLSYVYKPFFPKLRMTALRRVFQFTGWLMGVSALVALNNKAQTLLLGSIVGPVQTGAFSVGGQLAQMPSYELAGPMARAIYPGLTTMTDDLAAQRDAFMRGVAAVGVVALPAGVGLSVLAELLGPLVLGHGWDAAIPVIRWLAPAMALAATFHSTQAYAMAVGRLRPVFVRELIFLLIHFPFFIWSATTYGFEGAIKASALLMVTYGVLQSMLIARLAQVPFYVPLLSIWRSLAAAGVMAVTVTGFLSIQTDTTEAYDIVQVVVAVGLGAVTYAASLFGSWWVQGRPSGVEADILRIVRSIGR